MADESDLMDSDASISDIDVDIRTQSLPADAAELKRSTTGPKPKQYNVDQNAWEEVEKTTIRREHITIMRKMALRERQDKRKRSKNSKNPKRVAVDVAKLEKEFGTVARLNDEEVPGDPDNDTPMTTSRLKPGKKKQKKLLKEERKEYDKNKKLSAAELNSFIDETQRLLDSLRSYAKPDAPPELETSLPFKFYSGIMGTVRKRLTDLQKADKDGDEQMEG
ncbi:MAG: hypothetical protein M1831_001016 [Alyxoria varia]|nr:MAG: hypothetical protein M1831_001016 [Alyxoria varia]